MSAAQHYQSRSCIRYLVSTLVSESHVMLLKCSPTADKQVSSRPFLRFLELLVFKHFIHLLLFRNPKDLLALAATLS